MRRLRLVAMALALPLIVTACHTPNARLRIVNTTSGCLGGPCILLVVGNSNNQGTPCTGCSGADTHFFVVNPGQTSEFQTISSGTYTQQTISACHNLTRTVTYTAGLDWTTTFFCGTSPDGDEQSLDEGKLPV